MKKYILPAIIMIASIFFLNFVIDPNEEKKKAKNEAEATTEESSDMVPMIIGNGQSQPAKLVDNPKVLEGGLSSIELADFSKDLPEIEVPPFEEVSLLFSDEPKQTSIMVWNPEIDAWSDEVEGDVYRVPRYPGSRVLVINSHWEDKETVTYIAKVRIFRVSSYQELLSPDPEKYTVIGFFAPGEKPSMPDSNDGRYDVNFLHGNLDEFRNDFGELDITKLPAYIVFQRDFPIFKANDINELETYLTSEKQFTFVGDGQYWDVKLTAIRKFPIGTMSAVLRYKSEDYQSLKELEFTASGPSWSYGMGGLQINGEREYKTEASPFEWILTEEDEITLNVKWDGKEETFPVSAE